MSKSRAACPYPLSSLFLVVIFLGSVKAFSYPDFIGYGYTNCLVCHTSSLGGGSLSDYGRALFAQEIAARPFIPKSVSDEKLAEYSGFIPGVTLPFWIRPSIKYRGLSIRRSPGGSQSQSYWIFMQRDLGLVLSADEDQRTILSATYNLLPKSMDYYNDGVIRNWISREHYVRFYPLQNLLVAVGLMDKAYGIKTADHTAFSRAQLGFGQEDGVHGILFHYLQEKWDLAIHVFNGNLSKKEELRQKGFSVTGEIDFIEANRLGSSLSFYRTGENKYFRFALHDRWGLPKSKGSSLWFEAGLKRDQSSSTDNWGHYFIAQSLISLTRGYNFFTTLERYQDITSLNELDRKKWSFGFLCFPWQRLEARLYLTQTKDYSPYFASDDQWTLQGQVHASF